MVPETDSAFRCFVLGTVSDSAGSGTIDPISLWEAISLHTRTISAKVIAVREGAVTSPERPAVGCGLDYIILDVNP